MLDLASLQYKLLLVKPLCYSSCQRTPLQSNSVSTVLVHVRRSELILIHSIVPSMGWQTSETNNQNYIVKLSNDYHQHLWM